MSSDRKCEYILYAGACMCLGCFWVWGIMSCLFAALLHSTTTFPPHSYTTYCSLPLHPFISNCHSCHLCYCQSYESLLRNIIGGRIFALDVILSALYLINTWRRSRLLELALEIRGRCAKRGASVLNPKLGAYEFTLLPLPLNPPPSTPITALLTRCKVMSAPAATRLKGISLFHVGFSLASAGTT